MSVEAFAIQLWASNSFPELEGSEPTNASSPRFGFGADVAAIARGIVISPTPAAVAADGEIFRAVFIRSPLIWSGVHVGCRARTWAASPDTTGAANDVPDSWMRFVPTSLSGRCAAIVELDGIGPTM